jgi:hypothetical protein
VFGNLFLPLFGSHWLIGFTRGDEQRHPSVNSSYFNLLLLFLVTAAMLVGRMETNEEAL